MTAAVSPSSAGAGRLLDLFFLSLLGLALYLPGLTTLPPLDRDEARFAQASRQMVESGDFIRIQFQEVPRHKKPAGIYWMQAGLAQVTGLVDRIWVYRLPSLLGALLAVWLSYLWGRAAFGRQEALIGAGLLASCLMLVGEAHQAKTDAMLLATVVATQAVLGQLYLQPAWRQRWATTGLALGLAVGLGVLIKGPIVFMVAATTILALWIADRRLDWLPGGLLGVALLIAAAVAAPWFIAISQLAEGSFVQDAVQKDLLPKLLGGHESHGAYPGTYLALAPVLLWPGSLFLVPALLFGWRRRQEPAVRFALAWLIPAWVVFEIVPTKLPHYVLPTVPALFLLAAAAITRHTDQLSGHRTGEEPSAMPGERDNPWLTGRIHGLSVLLWAAIGLALAVAVPGATYWYGAGPDLLVWGASLSLVLLLGLGGRALWHDRPHHAAAAAILVPPLFLVGVGEGAVPRLTDLQVSERAVTAVRAVSDAPIASAGFHEPSLVFLAGTATRLTEGSGAADHIAADRENIALVESKEQAAFEASLQTRGIKAERLTTITGFNYSRGRPVTIDLVRRKDG